MKKLEFALLIALCFLVYANSLNNAFVSDDIPAILENPSISHPQRLLTRPPEELLNSLCFLLGRYNPFIYHLLNTILHSLDTLLVFIFLGLFFNPAASLMGACLFAVHPVHAEAVSWISGKPYLLLTLAVLGTYLLYNKSLSRQGTPVKPNIFLYILTLLIFSYSLLKAPAFYFLTPFFLILTDIALKKWRERLKFWLPFLFILGLRIVLIKYVILQRQFYLTDVQGGGLLSINPLVKFILVVSNHLWLLLWPFKLTIFHEPVEYAPWQISIGVVCFVLLVLTMPLIFKKSRAVFLSIVIFILFLFPVYSPIPLASNLVAEHYIYLPSISLSILAAFLYQKRKIPLLLFVLLISLLGWQTFLRNQDWSTPEKFWKATVKVSYKSPSAYNALGLMYKEKGDFDNALIALKKAITLKPDFTFAYNNLGNLYSDMGRRDEAIAYYKKALSLNPRDLDAYYNLGITYAEMGKENDSIAYFRKAV